VELKKAGFGLTFLRVYPIINVIVSKIAEGPMNDQNANEDQTQIRKPSQPLKKIPERFQASVVIVQGYAAGMEYLLTKEHTVIGRDKSADIALKDALVSREHAAIMYRDGNYLLKDLGSTNGTRMGGTLINQADLHHGDKFRIGDTTLQFILEDTGGGKVYEIE
jgi:pSer/pThr/pTyr-binding forkhead associated (FHA) protein